MNLERRLRAVERVLGARGECAACRDMGGVVTVVIDGGRPEPKTCAACGKMYERQVGVVVE
jgi:hypothetical protein